MKQKVSLIKASCILLILALTNCVKKEADLIEKKNNLSNENITSRPYSSDNYLNFVSLVQYDSILNEISALNDDELKTFMINFDDGFKSMQTIAFENSIADSIYDANLDTNAYLAPENYHCPEIMNELGKMYYAEEQPEGGYIVRLNLYHPFNSRVVNKSGIVRVGDNIWQFTKDYDKWIPADRTDLIGDMILATASSGDITVREPTGIPVVNAQLGAKTAGCGDPTPAWWCGSSSCYTWWRVSNQTTWGPSGKFKLKTVALVQANKKSSNCLGMYKVELYVDSYGYKRKAFGRWLDDYNRMTSNLTFSKNHPVVPYRTPETYWVNNDTHYQYQRITYNDISFSTYPTALNIYNVYFYATKNGGPSGGSVLITH